MLLVSGCLSSCWSKFLSSLAWSQWRPWQYGELRCKTCEGGSVLNCRPQLSSEALWLLRTGLPDDNCSLAYKDLCVCVCVCACMCVLVPVCVPVSMSVSILRCTWANAWSVYMDPCMTTQVEFKAMWGPMHDYTGRDQGYVDSSVCGGAWRFPYKCVHSTSLSTFPCN